MYSIGIQSKENKIIHEHHEKSLNAYVENEYYIVINNGENVKEKNNGQIKRPHRNPSNVGILTLVFNSDFSNISICIKKNGDTVYYDNELSIKTFDILLQNIEEDKGQQAYFVFVDLLSNMYIYNEFCQIKPTDEWYDISSLPWIKNDLSQQRQLAYAL